MHIKMAFLIHLSIIRHKIRRIARQRKVRDVF